MMHMCEEVCMIIITVQAFIFLYTILVEKSIEHKLYLLRSLSLLTDFMEIVTVINAKCTFQALKLSDKNELMIEQCRHRSEGTV